MHHRNRFRPARTEHMALGRTSVLFRRFPTRATRMPARVAHARHMMLHSTWPFLYALRSLRSLTHGFLRWRIGHHTALLGQDHPQRRLKVRVAELRVGHV